MPAHRTGWSAFLGRVPNLNEFQANLLIEALGNIQSRLLRKPLQLPPFPDPPAPANAGAPKKRNLRPAAGSTAADASAQP